MKENQETDYIAKTDYISRTFRSFRQDHTDYEISIVEEFLGRFMRIILIDEALQKYLKEEK